MREHQKILSPADLTLKKWLQISKHRGRDKGRHLGTLRMKKEHGRQKSG